MDLKKNQAALILSASEDGEITMDVESPDMNGLASALCHALAKKLMRDEAFQAELMEMLQGESEGKDD
jgi:hypothetical protein